MEPTEQTPTTEPVEPQEGTQEPQEQPDTFPRAYVEELRAEAAEARTKAKTADTLREALQSALLAQGSAGVLHEPLAWDDSYNGEDGMPDVEKVREAAEALAQSKPWLSRPRGDAGGGFRGEESDAVDLAALLRAGA